MSLKYWGIWLIYFPLKCRFKLHEAVYCIMWPQSVRGHENCAVQTSRVCFLLCLRYRGWQIDVVIVLYFSPVVYFGEKRHQGWVVKECWTNEGGRVVFGCLFSCFSEIYVIAPVGSTLTPGHVRHGLEVNSTEFQWSCLPCLFGFYGETGRHICNRMLLGYCYSAYSLSLFVFIFLLSLSQSLNLCVSH